MMRTDCVVMRRWKFTNKPLLLLILTINYFKPHSENTVLKAFGIKIITKNNKSNMEKIFQMDNVDKSFIDFEYIYLQ